MPTPLSCPASPTVIVFDFETTGQSPKWGDRPIEIGAVRIEEGCIVDRFQALMQPGFFITRFIESLTGISNAMLATAPPAEAVMREAARFVGSAPMVAHNATFDSKFWQSELQHAGLAAPQPFACTVLLSRRVFPDAPSHSLGRITDHLGLPRTGRAHRALADAEMAAALLARMQRELCQRFGVPWPDHALLMQLQRCARQSIGKLLDRLSTGAAHTS